MGKVLLYNFWQESRRKRVKALLFRLGLPSREVSPEEQDRLIGDLLEGKGEGADDRTGNPGDEANLRMPVREKEDPFQEEMIVMQGLAPRQFHALLDGLKAAGIRVPLKAVVTAHNVGWTSKQLYQELRAESAAMAAGGAPVHTDNA